jgi:teichoic acid transport system permease protein
MVAMDTPHETRLQAGEAATLAEEFGLEQIGVRPKLRRYLQGLWARRQFVWTMATSNAYVRSSNNYLGQAWNILNPLLWSAVYFVAFGLLLGARGDMDSATYVAFLVTGVFMFRFISSAMTSGAKSISGNISLVRSLHFPRAALPVSTALTEFVVLIPALLVLCLIVAATGQGPSWAWLLFPAAVLLVWLFCTGLTLITSRLVADVRDLANLLPFLSRLLLYTSGVFYSIDRFKDRFYDNGLGWLYPIAENQPVAVYLSLVRSTLLDEVAADGLLWIFGGGYAVIFLVGGFLYFWRAEERYGRD